MKLKIKYFLYAFIHLITFCFAFKFTINLVFNQTLNENKIWNYAIDIKQINLKLNILLKDWKRSSVNSCLKSLKNDWYMRIKFKLLDKRFIILSYQK
jgi:hypothetical protein